MKKLYEISLHGCDDSTVFTIELVNEEVEVELIKRLSKLSQETSTYCCMPIMEWRVVEVSE